MTQGLIICGDVLDGLARLGDNSVDAVVTDPPYELAFMGKKWDATGVAFRQETWEACLRVLKPGGHLIAFGGGRTHHRMWCAIEDAGFECRECIMWLFATGFPKSLNVSKAIDKAAGAEPEVVGEGTRFGRGSMRNRSRVEMGYRPTEINPEGGASEITAPATDAAKQWEGWGTALKPATEPILWATKPLTPVPIPAILLAETQAMVGGVLCQLLSNANSVDVLSQSSPNVSDEEFGSALLAAAVFRGSASAEWCEKMATYSSPEMVAMCLSIVKSWRIILDVVYQHGSRFTISMATGLTTALKTLNSCLLNSIPLDITRAVSRPVGELSTVPTVGKRSRAERGTASGTRKRIVAALASLRQVRKSAPTADANIMPVV
ncbi:hypothetical protein LCGC14_2335810, partial [marine sediment metagenome]